MNKEKPLQVKPVKRYRKPKYPSHQDPDPTLYPQPIPYPASRQLISALATSAGMVVTASCSPPTEDSPIQSDASNDTPAAVTQGIDRGTHHPDDMPADASAESLAQDDQGTGEILELIEAIQDSPFAPVTKEQPTAQQLIDAAGGNPFCPAVSGLPHQTSGFGTGMPNYIQADLARRVIERVFRTAGYQLKPKYQYDRDGVAMVLDGYDEQNKLGYVVGDWKNLDNDAVLQWWAPPLQQDNKKYETEISTLAQSLNPNDPGHAPLLADIQAAQKQADPARRNAAFKAILTKHRKQLLSLKEIQQLDQRAREGEDFVAVISIYDRRFAHPTYPHISPSEQAEINKIADPGKRNAATKALLEQKARVAVEALEKAAREYIRWAQRQGLN